MALKCHHSLRSGRKPACLLIDLLTILLTGISSIGCSVRMRKEGLVSLPGAIFMGVGCFIYCVDVVIAIVYVVKARKKSPAK